MHDKPIVFNVSRSYEIKQVLGQGAYGIVASAIHKPSGTTVAVKKVEPFIKPLVCLRTIRELHLLNFFRNHENIIGFYDVQRPKDFDSFNEVYLIQEFMPTDLHKVIHSLSLLDQHIQYIIYQILRGLKTIHSANVIHRDLKPSNILVNYNCDVKICDFGLARITGAKALSMDSKLTEYVATRWYRAPEIMLLQSMYSTGVDLWSVGCMIAEMYLGYPLFPGRDYKNQLSLILQYLGTPSELEMGWIKLPRARSYINQIPELQPLDPETFFNTHPRRYEKYKDQKVNQLGLNLMTNLLTFNPADRLSASNALLHPYLQQYHDPDDEPEAGVSLEPDYFDQMSKADLTIMDMKKHLFEEILEMTSCR